MTPYEGFHWKRVTSLLAVVSSLLILGCSALPIGENTGAKQVEEFKLQMAAGPIGERLLVTNHSDEPWENVVMIINENSEGGGYRLTVHKFASQASLHFGLTSYRNSGGKRFDPATQWLQTFTVYADTPRGHGHWSSAYPRRR